MEWYPRYPMHYDRDTLHLTLEQHGAYCLLIDHYMHTEKPLPDDDDLLLKILRVDRSVDQAVNRSVIRAVRDFFDARDGLLFHKKCEAILAEQHKRLRQRREASKKGVAARKAMSLENKNNQPTGQTGGKPSGQPSGAPSGQPKGNRVGQPHNITGQYKRESLPQSSSPSSAREQDDDDDFFKVAERAFTLAAINPETQRDLGASDRLLIKTLLNEGADPERHVYAAIEHVMENRNGEAPQSLRYFARAIRERMTAVAARPNGSGSTRPPEFWDWTDSWQRAYMALENYEYPDRAWLIIEEHGPREEFVKRCPAKVLEAFEARKADGSS